ncbi:hypothetical protein GJ744_009969 [Endocarpon pusillum]|uniref:Uncharacterized protein n=1 Tax=Endocarpon pusillum TaxID=364733 RepID=A0A8H7AMS2_9EURO|nr:hypothetical protein GJ744_009969 [Endocarpon pusillum]
MKKHLFAGDEHAGGLLIQLYAGFPKFANPTTHLGFGVDFHQPAVIAEALAQAAMYSREAQCQEDSGRPLFELIKDI